MLWNGASRLQSYAGIDGSIILLNSTSASFNLLKFGGETTSFPAIKRSSATLAIRLADDSADAALSVSNLTASGNIIHATQTPASAGAAGTAGTITWDASFIYVCTATNTWKRVAISTW